MKRAVLLVLLIMLMFVLSARTTLWWDNDEWSLYKNNRGYLTDSLNMHINEIYPVGMGRDFDIYGNYAYILIGDGLIILDISDSSNPQEISSLSMNFFNDMEFGRIHVYNGEYAYITSGYSGVWIVDVSYTRNPVVVGRFKIEGVNITDAIYYGGYMYVVGDDGYIYVVNVNDPSNPFIVKNIDCSEGGSFGVVKIIDDYLLAFNDNLYIYDINVPSSPNLVNTFELGCSYPYSVTISDTNMFVCFNNFGYTHKVILYSFSLPDSFVYKGEWEPSLYSLPFDNLHPLDIYVKGDTVYACMWGTFDLPANGVVERTFTSDFLDGSDTTIEDMCWFDDNELLMSPVPEKIKDYNGKTYVLTSNSFVCDIDMENDTIRYEGIYNVGDIIEKVQYSDSNVYVLLGENTIGEINLADAYNTTLKFFPTNNGSEIKDFAIKGDYEYIIDNEYLYLYDISSDSIIISMDIGSPEEYDVSLLHIMIYKDYLFVEGDTKVLIFDISLPNNINFISSLGATGYMIAKDDYLYMCNFSNFYVYDISDINNITLLSGCDVLEGEKMVISDNYAYISKNGRQDFEIIDISDPYNVYNLGRVETDTIYVIEDMAIDTLRNYLYVGTYGEIYVYDVKNGDNPVVIDYYPLNRVLNMDLSDDGTLWVGGVNGLFNLSLDEISAVDNNRNDREEIKVAGLWKNIAFDLRNINEEVNVKIYDITGRKIEDNIFNGGKVINISVNNVGVYYYIVRVNNNFIIRGKVIVK